MNGAAYLAIHWRYDRFDFGKHCRSAGGENRQACGILKRGGFNETHLAQNLLNYISQQKLDINTVYFATTLSQKRFAKDLKSALG